MRRLPWGIFLTFILLALVSCHEQAKSKQMPIGQASSVESSKDDFSDLKPKEGGCTKEEDLKKKLEEESQAKKPGKLQGGNTDCKVN